MNLYMNDLGIVFEIIIKVYKIIVFNECYNFLVDSSMWGGSPHEFLTRIPCCSLLTLQLFVVSQSLPVLPFQLDDAMRPDHEEVRDAVGRSGGLHAYVRMHVCVWHSDFVFHACVKLSLVLGYRCRCACS